MESDEHPVDPLEYSISISFALTLIKNKLSTKLLKISTGPNQPPRTGGHLDQTLPHECIISLSPCVQWRMIRQTIGVIRDT